MRSLKGSKPSISTSLFAQLSQNAFVSLLLNTKTPAAAAVGLSVNIDDNKDGVGGDDEGDAIGEVRGDAVVDVVRDGVLDGVLDVARDVASDGIGEVVLEGGADLIA